MVGSPYPSKTTLYSFPLIPYTYRLHTSDSYPMNDLLIHSFLGVVQYSHAVQTFSAKCMPGNYYNMNINSKYFCCASNLTNLKEAR